MSAIDLDTLVLPDMLTLPLLWAGLITAAAGATITPEAAVLGAIVGYLPLVVLCRGFKLVTGHYEKTPVMRRQRSASARTAS